MNLREKTEHLQDVAMTEARLQADGIVKQHRDALLKVFYQHRQEALRQSETRLKAEVTTGRQELNLAATKAQMELKRELGKTQAELKKVLFEEVERLLREYMETEEYTELLVTYIKKAVKFADGAATTLYINPSDADKKEYLEERTGMTLTVSKEDFIGGVRAVIREKNILIDHAFKGAIEREYNKFLFRGGAGIGK